MPKLAKTVSCKAALLNCLNRLTVLKEAGWQQAFCINFTEIIDCRALSPFETHFGYRAYSLCIKYTAGLHCLQNYATATLQHVFFHFL